MLIDITSSPAYGHIRSETNGRKLFSVLNGPPEGKVDDDLEAPITAKLGSGKTNKLHPMGSSPFAMDNRDPNNLNAHVQVMFDDIVGEPAGLRTPDSCWNCSSMCYDRTRQCCYVVLVVLFAPCLAFCNGLQFACLAFSQVWCIGPCLRLWKINFATVRKFYWGCLLAMCGPCSEVMGLYFSKIKVRYQKVPDEANTDNVADEYFNV